MAGKTMSRTILGMWSGGVREFEETLVYVDELLYGEPIFYPRGKQSLFVALEPDSGTGKVQYTMHSIARVKAGTATWKDCVAYPNGVVAIYTDDVLHPCTAIRQVTASGTTMMFGGAR